MDESGDPGIEETVDPSSAMDARGAIVLADLSMRIGREPNILAYDTLCARLPDSDLDLDALEVSAKLLDDDTSLIPSVTACAAQLGIERKQFRKMLALTASLAVRYERNLRERVEESLAMRAGIGGLNLKRLAYAEYASYD